MPLCNVRETGFMSFTETSLLEHDLSGKTAMVTTPAAASSRFMDLFE